MTRNRIQTEQMSDSLAVERCIVELQRGREVVLTEPTGNCAITLVESLTQDTLTAIRQSGPCRLIVSATRASVLDHEFPAEAAMLNLPEDVQLDTIRQLAGLQTLQQAAPGEDQWQGTPGDRGVAALQLARLAHTLPALLIYPLPVGPGSILSTSVTDALTYRPDTSQLMVLSRTRIPVCGADSVELIVFRERHGSAEHVAMVVGHPDNDKVVTVRLHSSCFTGDILGSLRCDCGEQLSGAISSMASAGGGVVLYLSQEGRGIGLASKLRAYQLQDEGLDTLEANEHLGFGEDERQYQAATTMLKELNVQRIRLMTNNPLKIEALKREGVDVVDRLPSHASVNLHNARYLETKRTRAGHLLHSESAV